MHLKNQRILLALLIAERLGENAFDVPVVGAFPRQRLRLREVEVVHAVTSVGCLLILKER